MLLWSEAPSHKDDNNHEEEQKTEIIQGAENILQLTLQSIHKVKQRLDNCVDANSPASFTELKPTWEHINELKRKGIRLRYITEITKENITYCKKLLQVAEVRHLDQIKGNFGIID